MADGWATGDALFEPLAPPPRPRETRCPGCGRHLLHYAAPKGRPLCTDCEGHMLTLTAILDAARATRSEPERCKECSTDNRRDSSCRAWACRSCARVWPARCSMCGSSDACSCAAREAVRVLCAGLDDAELRAEIERIGLGCDVGVDGPRWRLARAALETERDRRRFDGVIATETAVRTEICAAVADAWPGVQIYAVPPELRPEEHAVPSEAWTGDVGNIAPCSECGKPADVDREGVTLCEGCRESKP